MEKPEARLLGHKFPGQPSLQGQRVGAAGCEWQCAGKLERAQQEGTGSRSLEPSP